MAAVGACACGQEATGRLWPSQSHLRVRLGASDLAGPSPAAVGPSPAATGRIPDDLPAVIRVRDLVLKFEKREGSNCKVCDSNE